MAKRKAARLGIVPRLLKGAVTVGVIPACAVGINEGCSHASPPVVAAYVGDRERLPPVVAAYMPYPEPLDAGVESTGDAGDAGDAGPAAGDAGVLAPVPSEVRTPPVVAAYPRGPGVPLR
jgi:hypothetical protein